MLYIKNVQLFRNVFVVESISSSAAFNRWQESHLDACILLSCYKTVTLARSLPVRCMRLLYVIQLQNQNDIVTSNVTLGPITLMMGNYQPHLLVAGDGHLMVANAALETERQPV